MHVRYTHSAHASVLEALSETMLRGIEADASALECVFAIQSGETLLTGIRLKRPGAHSSVHQPVAGDGGDGHSAGADTDVMEHVPAALAPLRRNERVRELLAQHQQDRQSVSTRAPDLETQRRNAMSSCVAAAAVLNGRSLASAAASTQDDPHWLQARAFFERSVFDDEDQAVDANADAGRRGSSVSSSSADLQGSAAGTRGIVSSSSSSAPAIKPQSLTAPALGWLRRWAINAVLDLVRDYVMTREIISLIYFDCCAQLCIDTHIHSSHHFVSLLRPGHRYWRLNPVITFKCTHGCRNKFLSSYCHHAICLIRQTSIRILQICNCVSYVFPTVGSMI
jgi:hypothetical protein